MVLFPQNTFLFIFIRNIIFRHVIINKRDYFINKQNFYKILAWHFSTIGWTFLFIINYTFRLGKTERNERQYHYNTAFLQHFSINNKDLRKEKDSKGKALIDTTLYLVIYQGLIFFVLFFLRTSEINLFYNLQVFYWHFLEILWLFIFLVFYKLFSYFSFAFIISFSIFNRMGLWRTLCLQSNIEEVLSFSFSIPISSLWF